MMCKADETGSLVPTVAKQIQSVDPVDKVAHKIIMVSYYSTDVLKKVMYSSF